MYLIFHKKTYLRFCHGVFACLAASHRSCRARAPHRANVRERALVSVDCPISLRMKQNARARTQHMSSIHMAMRQFDAGIGVIELLWIRWGDTISKKIVL